MTARMVAAHQSLASPMPRRRAVEAEGESGLADILAALAAVAVTQKGGQAQGLLGKALTERRALRTPVDQVEAAVRLLLLPLSPEAQASMAS